MKKVFTTGDCARICKVAPRTVSKWFDEGRLKGYRIPGSQDRRVPRDSLVRFLKEHGMPLGELELDMSHRVLLVGSDQQVSDRLKEVLAERLGFKVEVAADGFEAGMLAMSFLPNTLVIDLAIGRAECIKIATKLRSQDRVETSLVIGLAGEDEAEPQSLVAHGFTDVYKRPFDVAVLVNRIREIRAAIESA